MDRNLKPMVIQTGIHLVEEAPMIGASPDGIQLHPYALIEIKTVETLPSADSIPEHYRLQMRLRLFSTIFFCL